jgi:hypothetical protein
MTDSVDKTVAALAARDRSENAPPAKTVAPAQNRSVLHDLYDSLGKLLNPKNERTPMHAGKTIDETVDEAINGAKGASRDY